ncbi:MAG TPA: heparan-alpha-glucosaminide N-acetyltransferase domain-containing protein [Candidatus Dormibacteraeota bacterium]|jgi:uncharacterized membrane protein|nr:heparan-alpha-glucosaminide N-acetyltransferase domain-containing protein [Candidatus Dormibacteraeota bacterium]
MKRLAYIDWIRGLACVLMFQTHCYDSWLSPEARNSPVFIWSRLGGTFPAPLFIFLAGISFALVTERLREKAIDRRVIAKQTILRGAEVFGLGILFRIQEYALAVGHAPWTDLFRVDILNILGLSMMLMGVLCWFTSSESLSSARNRSIATGLAVAALIAMITPPLWSSLRPQFLPWPLESYVNGIHIYNEPQPWLFPLFPWSAFAFVGLAVGFFLHTNLAKRHEANTFTLLGLGGIAATAFSQLFDKSRIRFYAIYDYWHSNPNFFLMRCGLLLLILFFAYAWCRWGFAQKGFSPLIQLGKTSLLVYWVHIQFVYGGLSILPRRQCSVAKATLGLLTIFLAMLALSLVRTNWKKWRKGGALKNAVA